MKSLVVCGCVLFASGLASAGAGALVAGLFVLPDAAGRRRGLLEARQLWLTPTGIAGRF